MKNTTINKESMMSKLSKEIKEAKVAPEHSRRRVSSELDVIVMARGPKVAYAMWEENGRDYKIRKGCGDWNPEATYNSTKIQAAVISIVGNEYNKRFDLPKDDVKRAEPMRLTLEDSTAIAEFTRMKAVKNGMDPVEAMTRPNMSDYDKMVIAKYCEVMGAASTMFPIYTQTYNSTIYLDIEIPKGVEVKAGDKLTFHGRYADNGVKFVQDYMTRTVEYEIVESNENDADGNPVLKVKKHQNSRRQRNMTKAKEAMWNLLPVVELEVEDETEEMSF